MPLLLIVSHTAHYRRGNQVVGWGPTLREVDALASLFDRVTHLAPLHGEVPPESTLPYYSAHVQLRPVVPAGGSNWRHKLEVLARLPSYARTFVQQLNQADVVHVRAPANISLLAMVLLAFVRKPRRRWIKYAGNWRPEGAEPWSYRFQRWWLRRNFARAQVTVNGRWPGDPPHVHAFPNPCITAEEYARAQKVAASKTLQAPVTLVFAGALTKKKGAELAIETLAHVRASGVEAQLVVAGDGPQKPELVRRVQALGLEEQVEVLGFVPHPRMGELYSKAHFVLLPSHSEGWPKVLGEGMAYGAVPIASAVSSIPQVFKEAGCGWAVDSFAPQAYAANILEYLQDPQRWRREAEAGCAFAKRFTYEAHVERVRQLLELAGGGA